MIASSPVRDALRLLVFAACLLVCLSPWAAGQEAGAETAEPAAATLAEAAPQVPAETAAETPAGEAPEGAESDTAVAPPAEPEVEEKKLRFTFRYQKWSDVLEWFAEQAGLSLVIDNPPPGTFNYTDDTRDFTISESLDLLNSVLLTKEYTLVRRDRMLLVLNVEDGIPADVVPNISLEELEERGNFELVTVTFPLGKRPAESVKGEIDPLLSQLGNVVILPQTKQILITERAGMMRAIAAIIESIPEPTSPAKPPAPRKPETPVLQVYPLQTADPAKVQEVLQLLFSTASFVSDPQARQVSAFATPSQQAGIKKMVDQMEANDPPDQQPRVEVYTLRARPGSATEISPRAIASSRRSRTSSQLVLALQEVVPEMRLSLDETQRKLIAWGRPQDHATLSDALEKLDSTVVGDQTRQAEVYSITRLDPDNIRQLLQNLFPDAELSVDSSSRTLIVVAPAEEQQAVRNLLEQLQPTEPRPDSPELRALAIRDAPADVTTMITSLVPGAQVSLSADGRRLLVVASPSEHEAIKKAVEQLEQGVAPRVRNTLKFYAVTPAQRTRFETILADLISELPGIKIITDAEPGELAAWALAEQHAVLAQVLEELKREVPEEQQYRLFVYPIERNTAANQLTILQELHPDLKIIEDSTSRRLLVWTNASQFDALTKTLQELLPESISDQQPQYVVYSVRGINTTTATAQLQSVAPDAQITVDAKTGKLVVWATPADHELLAAALKQLSQSMAESDPLQVEVLPLKRLSSTATLSLLQSMFPAAQFSLDAEVNGLITTAVAEDLLAIKDLMQKLQTHADSDQRPRFEVYSVRGLVPATVITQVQPLVPAAKLSVDSETGKLIAWATPDDHDVLAAALAELASSESPLETRQVEVFRLTKVDSTAALTLLQSLLPTAKLSVDAANNRLIALAVPQDLLAIRTLLEQLHDRGQDPDAPVLQVYPLDKPLEAGLLTAITGLVPSAQVTAEDDRLLVVATSEEHTTIEATLSKVVATLPQRERSTLVVYPLNVTQKKRFQAILASVTEEFPGVQVLSDDEPGEVAIWAKPSQHEMLTGLIEQLRNGAAAETQQFHLAAYPLKVIEATTAEELLGELYPNARIIVDEESNRLLIWAELQEHAAIRASIEEIDAGTPVDRKEKIMVYPLQSADSKSLLPLLEELLPDAKLSFDVKAGKLTAWAKSKDHETLSEFIEQMQAGGDLSHRPQVRVYPGPYENVEATVGLLSALEPEAKVVVSAATGGLAIFATPQQHETLAATLQQIKSTGMGQLDLKVYTLKGVTAQLAIPLLTNAVPGVTFAPGRDPQKLVAWARPDQHEKLARLVDQALAAGAYQELKVQVYTLKSGMATTVTPLLANVAPAANVTPGGQGKQLIVWASEEDHQAISKVLTELDTSAPEGSLATYSLKNIDGYSAYRLISAALPNVTFVRANVSDRLVVWAVPEDHKIIQQLLDQIDAQAQVDDRVFAVYPFGDGDTQALQDALEPILDDDVEVVRDETRKSLIVWATPEQHVQIKKTLEDLVQQLPAPVLPLTVVYHFEKATASAALTALTRLIPKATLALDAVGNNLVVTASEEDQQTAQAVVQQVDEAGADDDATVQVYALETANPTGVYTVLQKLYGSDSDVSLSVDTTNLAIVAVAPPEKHERIEQVVQQLEAEGTGPDRVLAVYPLESDDTTAFVQALAPFEAQGVNYVSEPRRKSLVVWATPKQHEQIQQTFQQLAEELPEPEELLTTVYHFEDSTALAAYTVLAPRVPEATMAVDTAGNNLVVTGDAEDHEVAKTTVEQLETAAAGREVTVKVYHFRISTPAAAYRALLAALPAARIGYDLDGKNLVVAATEEDHAIAQGVVDEMDQGGLADQAVVKVYRLESAEPASVSVALSSLYRLNRDVRISVDNRSRAVIAVAPPDEQIVIGETIQQIEAAGPGVTAQVHHLRESSPLAAYRTLGKLLPNAVIGYDLDGRNVVVTGTPEEHETANALVENMEQVSAEDRPRMQAYRLESADPENVRTVLLDLYPRDRDVSISLDSKNRSIFAVARPEQHQLISDMIRQMETEQPDTANWGTEVYHVKASDPLAAQETLAEVTPKARIVVDRRGDNLIVTASPEDHSKVETTIHDLDEAALADRETLQVYTLKQADPDNVFSVLSTLYYSARDVKISFDPKARAIVAVAEPDEHESIKQTIEQLDAQLPAGEDWTTQVYHFKASDPDAAHEALADLTPEARIVVDNRGDNLIVTASPEDHSKVETTIHDLDEAALADQPALVVHRLETADPNSVFDALQTLYRYDRRTNISLDTRSRSILAVAVSDEQDSIREMIEQLEAQGPGNEGWSTEAYHLKRSDPRAAESVLEALLPQAEIAYDIRGRNLLVTANAEDHATIKDTLEKMEEAGIEEEPIVQVYPLKTASPTELSTTLAELYDGDDDVQISADERKRAIVAVAPAEEQKLIQEIVSQVDSADSATGLLETRVYHLKKADPRAAYGPLESLLPDAEMAYDYRGGNLVVTARPEDHEIVKATVEEIDRATREDEPTPHVYRLKSLDPEDVFDVVRTLFEDDDDTRVSIDPNQDAIVVVAPPEQQETIKALIEDLEQGALVAQDTALSAYDLGEADGDAVIEMLESLLKKEIDNESIQLSILPQNNKLIAVAQPKEQEMIAKALEELKVEKRLLEVFQLQMVDPITAQLAIERLFGNALFDDFSAPSVEADLDTQQLFIRGTEEQLENIRELLVKMGEIQLGITISREGQGGTLRVVPFAGDSGAAINEILRIWPKIRRNEIRVITPSDPVPRLRPSAPLLEVPENETKKPEKAVDERQGETSDAAYRSTAREMLVAWQPATPLQAAAAASETPQSSEETLAAGGADAADDADSGEEPPAVVILPGENSITIASQDSEALDQIEALLSALARGTTGIGRDFTVFSLRNSAASEVADTIDQLFRAIGNDYRTGTGRVVVVPDVRLNAIVVHANRNDQAVVENLIRVLDTSDIPDSLAIIRPKLIPIKNTRASEIEDVLQSLYATQLRMGGGRRQLEIPRGVPAEVASVLRQVNAATSGPLLTISVDQLTNTLIVMGPSDLVDEISQVVDDLDQAALRENPTRTLKIVSLKKLNSKSLERALDTLLRQRSSRRGR